MYLIYYPLHAECNLVIAHIVPIHLTLHTLYSGYNTQCTPHIISCVCLYTAYILPNIVKPIWGRTGAMQRSSLNLQRSTRHH